MSLRVTLIEKWANCFKEKTAAEGSSAGHEGHTLSLRQQSLASKPWMPVALYTQVLVWGVLEIRQLTERFFSTNVNGWYLSVEKGSQRV